MKYWYVHLSKHHMTLIRDVLYALVGKYHNDVQESSLMENKRISGTVLWCFVSLKLTLMLLYLYGNDGRNIASDSNEGVWFQSSSVFQYQHY